MTQPFQGHNYHVMGWGFLWEGVLHICYSQDVVDLHKQCGSLESQILRDQREV